MPDRRPNAGPAFQPSWERAGVILLVTLAVFLAAAAAVTGTAQRIAGVEAEREGRKVVILVVDRVGAREMPSSDTPFLLELAARSAVGLMDTRYAVGEQVEAPDGGEYVTLGAGYRAEGSTDAAICFNSEQPLGSGPSAPTAGELYGEYTGAEPPPGSVICPAWPRISERNEQGDRLPGGLGASLAGAGKRVAVLGNQDCCFEPRSPSPLICCDRNGIVAVGDVGGDLVEYSEGSVGLGRTDVDALLAGAEEHLPRSDLLVVDTGDTARVDNEAGLIPEGRLNEEMTVALARADEIARGLYSMIDPENSLFMVVSPGAPVAARKEGNHQTPLIVSGPGFGHGFLSSKSTRRRGLVKNIDVAPTVLQFLELEVPDGMEGCAMERKPDGDTVSYLRRIYEQYPVTRSVRWPMVVVYSAFVLLVLLTTLAFAPSISSRVGYLRAHRAASDYIPPVAAVMLAVPIPMLLLGGFSYSSALLPLLFCVSVSIAVGLGAWFLTRRRGVFDPVASLCLTTASIIIVDLAMGGNLLLLPVIGSTALDGMRTYGLSNAMAALLIVCSVWAVAGFSARVRKRNGYFAFIRFTLLLGVALIIGIGPMGANFGASLVAFATALVFLLYSQQRIRGWARVAVVVLGTVAGGCAVALLDFLFFRTHLSKAMGGGSSGLWSILAGKVNIGLGEISVFLVPSIILISASLAVSLYLRRRSGPVPGAWEDHRYVLSAFFATVVGGLIAIVLNDTGISMLAIMGLIVAASMCYYATVTGYFGARDGASADGCQPAEGQPSTP